ncbi:UDP-2,3-diacylglucosamine diphosphatase [Helicobacter mesocricetorum]|uniref:UDP-2,3-diacylglucosamine diphosphatase n=1 Tax=Helicobacter mesocricetorum TaxID=87012 RepID=UPI000CF107DE|nr:metallophosphoesterase [Helicobacter mesocricetorum]
MSLNSITIKENAIFIADSHHHSLYRNTLDDFFQSLLPLSKRQIFLMGDIFDFLVGDIAQCLKDNQKTLNILEQLSLKHEIYYLEGNHDFLLHKIPLLKNIHCFSIQSQPICCILNQKKAYLAHGDILLSWHYKLYTALMRQRITIAFLNLFKNFLYPALITHLKAKTLKESPKDSSHFITQRILDYIKQYDIQQHSYIIEGHFHLNKHIKFHTINYIGLPLFACKKKYFVVEYENNYLSLKMKEF